jgi:hypothetical protein
MKSTEYEWRRALDKFEAPKPQRPPFNPTEHVCKHGGWLSLCPECSPMR